MNRFDRITSLLLLLQTRSVVTAQFLSEHFAVSERTIYRDIKSLENAGVPIGSEAGVGYFLAKGYHLPPVSFNLDEAAALLLGGKLLVSSLDKGSLNDFNQALHKVRAVMGNSEKDRLVTFDSDTVALPDGGQFPESNTRQSDKNSDQWLKASRKALLHQKVVSIEYASVNQQQPDVREVEPIGLLYYNWHWHLIAWCRLRKDYRDFRLDRVSQFLPTEAHFSRHKHMTLTQYLKQKPSREPLVEVELIFTPRAARFVQEQRYQFGFIEEHQEAQGVRMLFLTHVPEYMARWLLQYTSEVTVVKGHPIKKQLRTLSRQLAEHWR